MKPRRDTVKVVRGGIAGLALVAACAGLPACGAASSGTGTGTSSQSGTGPTASCTIGYVNIPAGSGEPLSAKTFSTVPPTPDTADGYSIADYAAMRLVITATTDTQINELTIVFYDSSDLEIGSAYVPFSQLVAAGQSMAENYDESLTCSYNPPVNAATCSVATYS